MGRHRDSLPAVEPVAPLLTFFLSVARSLGSLTNWLIARRGAERELVAAYFERVADCLREVAERIESGQMPHDTCRRLAVYADELDSILRDRGYVTASGDASIDETRMRLAGELMKASTLWDASLLANVDPTELAASDFAGTLAVTASRHSSEMSGDISATPSAETVARLEREVSERAQDGMTGAQPVWDAAGEFRALADALRAR